MDISFERLVSLFFNKLKYILIISIVLSVGTYIICNNFIEKKYTSSSALMIQINHQPGQNTNNELTVTKQSVQNYIRTLYTNNFFRIATDAINTELGTNYTYKHIKSNSIIKSASKNKSSSDFNISYTTTSPELAQRILFIITNEALDYLSSKNVSNPVDIIEDPSYPSAPSFPQTTDYTLYTFLISFAVTLCFFFFKEIMDDRIKNVKDIISAYNLPILGVIPDYIPSRINKKRDSHSNSYSKEETKNG